MAETIEKEVRIAAVLSCPRVGFCDHWGQTNYALNRFNPPIPIYYATGAFWGHSLQCLLEDRIADDPNAWVLTLDYDTVFTSHHVDALIRRMLVHPEIDALAALQLRRGSSHQPLVSLGPGVSEVEIVGQPVEAHWIHFGLTILRLNRLKDIPKPWFQDVPNKDGSWRGDRIDDDIYFWRKWKEHGNTCYIDPEVRVGHLQVLVSEFDEDFQPKHWHMHDWREKHGVGAG